MFRSRIATTAAVGLVSFSDLPQEREGPPSSQMMRCRFGSLTGHRSRQVNTTWFFMEMPTALLERVSMMWRRLFGPTLLTAGSRSVFCRATRHPMGAPRRSQRNSTCQCRLPRASSAARAHRLYRKSYWARGLNGSGFTRGVHDERSLGRAVR